MKKSISNLAFIMAMGALSISSGCSTIVPVSSKSSDLDQIISSIETDPSVTTNLSAFHYLRQGIDFLKADKLDKASNAFNRTLSFDPRNSYYHFFNGFTYHLIAQTSDPSKLESAKLAYELALKFDPNNYLASAQLGRINLKKNAYKKAQNNFAHALLYNPNDVDLLYVLAKSSYLAEDLATARDAISKAKELDSSSPEIMTAFTIITAASGEFVDARKSLIELESIESKPGLLKKIDQRILDWERFYSQVGDLNQNSQAEGLETKLNDSVETDNSLEGESLSSDPDMVILDVIMIRTEEFDTTNKGFNLLEGLSAQFDGSSDRSREYDQDGEITSFTKTLARNITIPQITYNLNIFNAADDRNEILARPTLIALDGQESTFFSGSTIDVALEGNDTASLASIEIGIDMKVTPTFLESGAIQFDVTVTRTFFEFGAAGTFEQSLRTSKNEVSAKVIMDFEQTLILSGLREKQTSESKTGVPLLRDIPVLQYLFSNEKTQDFHKSIMIMMTPHKVTKENDLNNNIIAAPDDEDLRKFKNRYGKNITITDNMVHVMDHLKRHDSYLELRETDIFDKNWWGDQETVDRILYRALSFLYY